MKTVRYALASLLLLLTGAFSFIDAKPPAGEGSLTGTLKSVWLRKYPMIVYLENVKGDFQPPQEKPAIDQKNKMFVPHVLPVLRGTMVEYLNHDDTKHNVYFVQPDAEKINLGTGMANWSRDHRMDQAGVYVHRCNIHDEMSAYVVVLDNPYYALIEKRAARTPAKFKLEGILPGEYKLRVWAEKFFDQKGHKFNRTWDISIKAGEETSIVVAP